MATAEPGAITPVDDIVSGIVSALAQEHSFEVFNLGNAQPVQPGDVPVTFASIAKAQALLGCHPATSFEDGVRRIAGWLSGL